MTDLLTNVIANTENETVLKFLKVNLPGDLSKSFRKWNSAFSGYDEGAKIFFDDYGAYIPADCKYTLEYNSLMINNRSGEIFAFKTGRFSMFFKCDFAKSNIENTEALRLGNTLDCITSITQLGNNWSYLDKFAEDEKEQLKWSYELTNK